MELKEMCCWQALLANATGVTMYGVVMGFTVDQLGKLRLKFENQFD